MILQLVPFLSRTIILSITPRGKGVELSQHSSTSMVVQGQHVGLFQGSDGGWNGANQGDRVRIDGEIVVEGIVE
jgi:hypothetical protein